MTKIEKGAKTVDKVAKSDCQEDAKTMIYKAN